MLCILLVIYLVSKYGKFLNLYLDGAGSSLKAHTLLNLQICFQPHQTKGHEKLQSAHTETLNSELVQLAGVHNSVNNSVMNNEGAV